MSEKKIHARKNPKKKIMHKMGRILILNQNYNSSQLVFQNAPNGIKACLDRFNEHRRTKDNPNTKSKPTTAAQHFLSSPNHTANDMQLIPIEKVFSDRDSIRIYIYIMGGLAKGGMLPSLQDIK